MCVLRASLVCVCRVHLGAFFGKKVGNRPKGELWNVDSAPPGLWVNGLEAALDCAGLSKRLEISGLGLPAGDRHAVEESGSHCAA